jgi:PAS domain S-box-containing protein
MSDMTHSNEPAQIRAAILKASLDCVITIDDEGRIIEFNSAAEQTFGFSRAEAVGKPLAELIVPPALREQHRRGLAHYLATGEGPVLNRRIEMPALRKDGTEFPVELTITRTSTEGRPLFTGFLRDITERKRHEALLRENEERYRLLIEGVRDYAIFLLDPAGHVASWNVGAERAKGFKAEEVIGRHFACFYRPEDIAAGTPERELEMARAEGRFESEGWRIRKDGSRFWANVLITAVYDEAGRLRGFSKVTRDMTERRKYEEKLRSVVDHVIDGIITIDDRGRIESFNPAAERTFGYTASEVVGQNVKMLMPAPFHAEHDGYVANYLRTGQAKIIGIGREVVGRRKDGSTFPMDLAVSTFFLDERRFFTGIVRDITERKRLEQELRQRVQELAEAEERMRSVVNHVVDGIITIDAQGHVAAFNPAAEKLFGYKASEVVGQNVKMLMPEPYHGEHDGYIANYLRTSQAKIIGIGREVVGRRKDGSTFPMDLAVSEFHLGQQRYFTGIVRDITERKGLEQELRQRVQELGEADRHKNEFLAMLAHELRNPLAPIRNALHILKMPGANEELVQQAHGMMERQVEHVVRLVDDLLDVSRIIRGKIELRKQIVDLAAVVHRAVETAQPVLDAQGHELTLALPHRPVFVEADLVRLAQVISNLLNNAAKYTDQAGRIGLSVERDGPEAVQVRVRDSGLGIAPELLPRIFDLFVQGDRSLARSQGGLGIGLTLVKSLVEMHGGSVTAFSAGPGQGSEFIVRLPTMSAHKPEQRKGPPETGAAGPSRRILVVDDNVDAAESTAMLLRLWGHEVQTVYDGVSVLETVRTFRPEMVLLDIGLPGITGYDVAKQLRQQPQDRRLILAAMTGYGQYDDRRRSQAAGFDFHLTKPLDPNLLATFVAAPSEDRRHGFDH